MRISEAIEHLKEVLEEKGDLKILRFGNANYVYDFKRFVYCSVGPEENDGFMEITEGHGGDFRAVPIEGCEIAIVL